MAITATTMTKAMCQTDIYKQYKHLTDVKVICIMKFPINDTTTTALTLFVPKTKEAVYYLAEEFNLGIEKDIIDKNLGNEYSGLGMCNVYKDNVKKRYGAIESPDDYKNISTLVYNYNAGEILIFHDIDTKERSYSISSFLIEAAIDLDILPKMEK